MSEVSWHVNLIMSWLPFVLLVGTGIWLGRAVRAGTRTKDGRLLAQVVDDHTREQRRSNDLLADALKSYQDRLEALGQTRQAGS